MILRQILLKANSATNGWIRISKSYQDFQTAANIEIIESHSRRTILSFPKITIVQIQEEEKQLTNSHTHFFFILSTTSLSEHSIERKEEIGSH